MALWNGMVKYTHKSIWKAKLFLTEKQYKYLKMYAIEKYLQC